MTSKSAQRYIPNDPSKVMVIRDITPQITTLSVPFARGGLVKIGGRATLVKLQTGSLAVFSPVALTPEVQAKVAAQGNTLKYIIAPDYEHHIFVSPWAKAYPDAEVIGPEGLPEKREKDEANRGIKFNFVFTDKNKRDLTVTPEFDAEFEYEYVPSHANKELVFLHKPSRTLIQADLMWNLPATEQYSRSGIDPTSGFIMRLVSGMLGTRGDMIGQRRFLWYLGASLNRKSFADSARRIQAWGFDRIIPCHGDVIETGGKEKMEKLTRWFREMK